MLLQTQNALLFSIKIVPYRPDNQQIKTNIYDISIFTRDSIYAIARICYRPSVRPSDHRKPVEVRIMKFSPYRSPIPLVFVR